MNPILMSDLKDGALRRSRAFSPEASRRAWEKLIDEVAP
jgi:hypothetical protein